MMRWMSSSKKMMRLRLPSRDVRRPLLLLRGAVARQPMKLLLLWMPKSAFPKSPKLLPRVLADVANLWPRLRMNVRVDVANHLPRLRTNAPVDVVNPLLKLRTNVAASQRQASPRHQASTMTTNRKVLPNRSRQQTPRAPHGGAVRVVAIHEVAVATAFAIATTTLRNASSASIRMTLAPTRMTTS